MNAPTRRLDTAPSPPARLYFEGLDALRAFAALSVLAYHTMGTNGLADVPTMGPLAWIRCGWVGVDIFFVVSGLVVGQAALAGYRRKGAAFRGEFVRHRLARIVPLYLVSGLACLCLLPLPADWSWSMQIGTHLVFLHNLWPSTIMAIDPPTWSLSVEMQLYALLLLATPVLARCAPLGVALSCVLGALLFRIAAYATLRAWGIEDAALWQHAATQTFGLVDSFGLGLAASMALAAAGPPRLGRWACVALVALGLAGLAALGLETTQRVLGAGLWQDPAFAIGLRTGIAVSALSLVLGCALFPLPREDGGLLRRIGKHLGDLSYGIYLWHFLVLMLALPLQRHGSWILLACVVAGTLILAELTWQLLERPLLRRLRRSAP